MSKSPLYLALIAALFAACRNDPAPPVDVDAADGGRDGAATDALDGATDRPPSTDVADGVDADAAAPDLVDTVDALDAADTSVPDVEPDLAIDLPPPPDTSPPVDLAPDLSPDVQVTPPGCGSARPDVSGISMADGLAIGGDGTLYFTQPAEAGGTIGWVGRLRPGAAVEPKWVAVPEGASLQGLATDGPRQRLYLSSASGHLVQYLALDTNPPALRVLTRDVHQPDDLAVGPNGTVFFPDSDSRVYRVVLAGMAGDLYEATQVFTTNSAGLAFAKTGELLVGTLNNGSIFKIQLVGEVERMRAPLGAFKGWARGLAVDDAGRIYVANTPASGAAQVIRLDADGGAPTLIGSGAGFRSLAFGRGALDCHDLYVASATGPIQRFTTDGFAPVALP